MMNGFTSILWIVMILCGHSVMAQGNARELFKFAKFKFDKGEYLAALDYVDRAIQADGSYANAFLLRADIHYRQGEYEKTVADLSTGLKSSSQSSMAYADYYLIRARSCLELELYEKASADLEILFNGTVQNADAYYARAMLCHHRGDLKGALDDLDRAILMSSNVALYYLQRARIKEVQVSGGYRPDAYSNIFSDLSVALALDHENYAAYEMRSRLNQRMGQRAEAIADYSRMIELNTGDIRAYYERGVLKMQEYRYKEAIDDFGVVIQFNADDYLSRRNIAICYQNMEQHQLAVREYSRAIRLMDDAVNANAHQRELLGLFSETLLLRGHCYHLLHQPADACHDFMLAYNLGNKKGLNYHRKYCSVY